MAYIKASGVTVDLPVVNADSRSLRKTLLKRAGMMTGRFKLDERARLHVRALKDLSFELHDGDRLGLIGRNGAGKSTLLRVLAGAYVPSRGTVDIEGRVVPLLTVGVGIRDDSTGYENIRICGLLLGMTREQIRDKTEEIAEFTELGPYLSMPLYTYSAGMRIRLAFAIATTVPADILLIDEVLGAGDAGFIKKAEARLNNLIQQSRIVVLATHSDAMIQRDCNKAMWLDEGQIKGLGDAKDVVARYAASVA
jgi:ABC-2 type transport system ATP-binding protein/lipopolysaccharide transport system ATP-binding protein